MSSLLSQMSRVMLLSQSPRSHGPLNILLRAPGSSFTQDPPTTLFGAVLNVELSAQTEVMTEVDFVIPAVGRAA